MRALIPATLIPGLLACAQPEGPPPGLPPTEYRHILDSKITIDGTEYVVKSKPKFRGGQTNFLVIDGKTYRCADGAINEENCRVAIERSKRAPVEHMGGGY